MKTKRSLWPLCAVACLTLSLDVQGQASVPGNLGGPTNYSGWNSATTIPLEVRHNGNYPIQWFTDSIQRMQLWNTQNRNINSFNIKQNGYVGISDQPLLFDGTTCPGPFSRLHLADSLSNDPNNFAQELGFRPWMRNGITFTGNADQGYMGQRYYDNDNTDMVIQWSDIPGFSRADRMRTFFFTSEFTGTPDGMNSLEGLEATL
ncbi:MAG: hypothetical protein KA408_09715 [Flavobacteriales bacterium]|nr:hypothetical protein [Flavobacteriales bacterium]